MKLNADERAYIARKLHEMVTEILGDLEEISEGGFAAGITLEAHLSSPTNTGLKLTVSIDDAEDEDTDHAE